MIGREREGKISIEAKNKKKKNKLKKNIFYFPAESKKSFFSLFPSTYHKYHNILIII